MVVNLLFEQERSHLAEYPAPGQELVGGTLGNIGPGIDSGGTQGGGGPGDGVAVLLASATDEDALHLLGILDVVRGVGTAAEETVVTEHFRTAQGDDRRLISAHGQAGHGAAELVGAGLIV